MIPAAFKTWKKTPRSFKLAEFIISLGQTPTFRCRVTAILKNGPHFGFLTAQSGKFDLKVPKNISRKILAYIIIYTIVPLSAILLRRRCVYKTFGHSDSVIPVYLPKNFVCWAYNDISAGLLLLYWHRAFTPLEYLLR